MKGRIGVGALFGADGVEAVCFFGVEVVGWLVGWWVSR